MYIYMVGIDHQLAPLDVRSVFSFTKEQTKRLYSTMLVLDDVRGCVIISTCNRMEVWLSMSKESDFSCIETLCTFAGIDHEEYAPFFAERSQEEAVTHLFYVTAGLRSRIFGEDQIITQVGDAIAFARCLQAADNVLEVLFRQAVTAAKRVKTETVLDIRDHSVIHTALNRIREDGIDVEGANCLVIGNGMMGRLAAQVLIESGANVTMTIRRYHHNEVAVPSGCNKIEYTRRYDVIPVCDLIVSATTSPHLTIDMDHLKEVPIEHEICMIDLAVPRDIDSRIGELSDVRLYDIDSFEIAPRTEQLEKNLRAAQAIMQEEQQGFFEWLQGRSHISQIETIKEAVGQDTVNRLIPQIRQMQLTDDEKEELKRQIAGAGERMMNHLLFGLQKNMSEDFFCDTMDAIMKSLYE